jgi:glucuronate isomerase
LPSNLERFGELTGEDVYAGRAISKRTASAAAYFKERGATSSDHGHATARTANLSDGEAEALFAKVVKGKASAEEADALPRPDADRDGQDEPR